jgi:hypothetical protein
MKNAELHTDQDEMWTTLFDEYHADLAIVAEMLLCSRLSPEAVLRKALTCLESSPCEETFGQAVRAVAEAAAQYNRETAHSPIRAKTPAPAKLRIPGISQIAVLPWPERAVYFLRGVLRYSCQETALLFGMSDAQINQFYQFAAKRIAY